MITLKNILVPTDLGEVSEAALTYGRALARRFGADLHVLHVLDNPFLRPISSDPLALKEAAYRQLRRHLTEVDNWVLHARAVVEVSDEPSSVIVDYARSKHIDLIVMGTHGRQGAAHFLMGSVAERVVRTAPCPVFTVRHPQRELVVVNEESQVAAPACG